MNKKLIRKMLTASGGPLFPWLKQNTEWADNWKFRMTPASRSKVLSGKGVETDKQYTERRKKETTKRTWRSDAADVAHGIGEGILALHPYTSIPYFGAKIGLDFLNGTYGWHTALNASVPLFHMAPQAVGLREATNVALEDAANAGSKTARNWRIAREIKLATKNKPNTEVPKPIIRTKIGDVEIDNPGLYYHQSDAGKAKNFVSTGRMRTPLEESWLAKEEAGEHIPIKIRSGIVPGYPQDPGSAMFAQGKLWYGLTSNKPDLLVTAREMPIANKNASVMSNKASLRQLEAQGTRRVTNDNIYTQGPHNRQNTTAYTWVPGYGYRLVVKEPSTSLAFFERKPSKTSSTMQISPEELNALRNSTRGNSRITASDIYKSLLEAKKYKDSKGYTELVHRTQKEAEEMGLPFNSDLYTGVSNDFPDVKLSSRPEGKLGGYRRFTNTIELDPDLLTPTEGKYVPFHEGLHWQRVGTPQMNSPLYNRWKENMQDDLVWREFYRSEEYKNLAYEDNAKAYARNKVKEALYEDADPYLSIPGELLANGLEAGRAIGLEPFEEYPGYGKALKAVQKARNYNSWLSDVKAGTTLEMQNFWKILTGNYLPAVSLPLAGGYTLYNIFNQPLQQLQYQKQGGKMNILEFLKNGSGIHIKEKNKGKFTSYCGGKVTDECILKGKNSSNPAIRKRAVFAANARKWKHKEGGTVKALEGTKFNWGSAIGNLASNALLLGISTYMLNKKLSSDAEADKERYKSEAASKLQKDMQDERTKRFNILNAIKGTSDNPNAFGGEIFERVFINLGDNEAIRNYNQSISDYNKMIDLQIRAQKAENTGNFLSSLGLLGVGLLANSAFNKNSTNTSSASTSATSSTNTSYNLSNFWSTPSLSNYLSNLSSTQS